MKYDIVHPGSNSMVVIKLAAGEQLKANAGAMVAKDAHVTIDAKMDGGVGKALKRSLLGGEQLFFEVLTAAGAPGEVMIAPPNPGEITLLDMNNGEDYYLQGGAFLAALGEIQVDTRMQKLSQGLFSGDGLFILHCTGRGQLCISSFGGIYAISIPPGRDYVVDNGHLVAWSGDCSYTIEKAAKGWIKSMTSGEGLVCRFKGPGKVWIQTRNPHEFAEWLHRFMPQTSG